MCSFWVAYELTLLLNQRSPTGLFWGIWHVSNTPCFLSAQRGASTNGAYVEPFKSTLFAAADLAEDSIRVPIQPITVAYTRQAGRPMDQTMRDYYAWYAKMPFTAHFKNLFALKIVDVKVHFHPVCYLDQFESRKLCAEHCHRLVAEQLRQFL
jgi:1-acyl-sn-glycerol-3-phosphate acyltransferase